MTTEIAILNKSAVALAADSAVTIAARSAGGQPTFRKIYVDANKLFELVKGKPVGVMTYNSAEIAGVPWETLVKVFRTTHPAISCQSLADYAAEFLNFVQSRVGRELDDDAKKLLVMDVVTQAVDAIFGSFLPHLQQIPNLIDRRKKLTELLDELDRELAKSDIQEWADGIDEDDLWATYGADVVSLIPNRTDHVMLNADARKRVARGAFRFVIRAANVPSEWTGIVVAGFGEDELFPSVFHAHIGGFFADRLILIDPSVETISKDRPAIIQPYAQTGDAIMFLQGIDPAVSNAVTTFWKTWSAELVEPVKAIIHSESSVTDKHVAAIGDKLRAYMDDSWDEFSDFMDTQFHRKRLEPIEASASFLSKREIADLAENLVELTSLRNRVSLDRQETVGGATDVAVISKGDGFVWVKRKHYFSQDRNPAWAMRQALNELVGIVENDAEGGDASNH